MPIMNGNPLNGNPAAEEGNHEPAQNLRRSIYESAKLNLDESTHKLQESIHQWSIDESAVVEKILLALDVAVEEVDTISAKIKVADEATHEFINTVLPRILGNEHAELSAILQAQLSQNVELVSFCTRLKYSTFMTLEHDINIHHNKADTKRSEFKAHIDAVNDVSEIMSGDLVRTATRESVAHQNAAAVRAAIEDALRLFVGGVVLLNVIILLLVYYQIIPPFIVIYIARCVIKAVGGNI